ncbi:signal peptide peptidase SppA [candidate division WOR-3 bacterium]|nr:signal peptide peptidase SppA [candidate division WOR-3 bacterium]
MSYSSDNSRRLKIFLAVFIITAIFFTTLLSKLIYDFFKNMAYQRDTNASCLCIRLSGNYREIPGFYPADLFSGYNDITVEDLIQAIKKARGDENIHSIFLEIHGIENGWSSVSDIRKELEHFRRNGKKVYVYINGATDKEYFLASVADSIYLSPTGSLFIDGLSSTVLFYAGLSEKLGVHWEVFSKGDYKSAPNVLTDTSLSTSSREDLTKILTSIHELYVLEVEKYRDDLFMPYDVILDSGPYLSAAKALSLHLVDRLESYENISAHFGIADSSINPRKYISQDINAFSREKSVCIIFIEGEISYGDNSLFGSDESQDARVIAEFIMKAADNDGFKALVIRVNSPGGDLDASFAIGKAVEYAASRKPVVASMGDMAASGGYFVSMYSDVIVASEFTVTGSIGVFMLKPDVSGLLLKTGLSVDTVKTNVSSDFMSIYRPLSPRETEILESYASEAYSLFTSEVSLNRELDSAFVESVAGGRVWTGREAYKLALIDTLGGLDLAVAIAKEMAEISVETSIGVEIYPEPSFSIKNLRKRAWMAIAGRVFPEASGILFLGEKNFSFKPSLIFPYKLEIH